MRRNVSMDREEIFGQRSTGDNSSAKPFKILYLTQPESSIPGAFENGPPAPERPPWRSRIAGGSSSG